MSLQFEERIEPSNVGADVLLDQVLGDVLRSLVEQLNILSAGVWLYDAMLRTTLLYLDYEDHQIQRGQAIVRPGAVQQNPLTQWDEEYLPLLQQKQVLVQTVQDIAPRSPEYLPVRRHNQRQRIRTIMVIPLFFKDTFLGNVTLRSLQAFRFSSDQMKLALALANQAAIALQFTQFVQQSSTAVVPQAAKWAPPINKQRQNNSLAEAGLTKHELDQVTNYIDHHLSEGIQLAELAQIVGMSPSHFARLFKQSTGHTPHQYTMHCRLEAAKWLLTTQQSSIERISGELGFANPGQFATFFRKQTGMPPSAYRWDCNSPAD
ncbi:helix-turn-helix transcriptional regulator [Leptolyngbya sp. FACHB-36]|uniref:helix-turn-helix domain-containing protein n=1 Tax=Leptolyngbya sp. FACHB-36 TaxID=2692808 RepID=UPI0016800190|nr:AraC family transcriptional regulator [Leptolyngbya sp. FACHB-36]MBD2019153.1 helix-turn-helix transcriptional regulator [Leptolyngbya sp. FACHB-36]